MGQSKSKSALEKHCVPLGVYPHCDWPLKTIKHLVCSKKLAPIYRGVDEQTSKDLEECPICFFVLISIFPIFSQFPNLKTVLSKRVKPCFLLQAIIMYRLISPSSTVFFLLLFNQVHLQKKECYLQIKGNPTNIISCPFCNKEDLKVVFLGPKSVEERKQEEEVNLFGFNSLSKCTELTKK